MADRPDFHMCQLSWSDAAGWHVASIPPPHAINGATTLAIALKNTGAARDIRIIELSESGDQLLTHHF
jgi:hypothetical protein